MPMTPTPRTRARRALLAALLATCVVAAAGAAPAVAAPSYPDAVLLVSGFDSATPFTTPAPACAGQEGGTWAHPGGVPAALRAGGRDDQDPLCATRGAAPPATPAASSMRRFIRTSVWVDRGRS